MKFINPKGWADPSGYANGVEARGQTIFIAGQIGWDPATAKFTSDDFIAQTAQALRNVVAVLREAGGTAQNLASMTWYVTDKPAYMNSRRQIGDAYREIIGRHFPAMSLIFVSALVEDRAKVEIEAVAVIPG